MELLAPAGTLEVFEVAVEAGADAVYIGAPFFNARELARHFTLAEVAAMIDHGHKHGTRVYLAMNSLIKEDEVAKAVESLAVLEKLEPDALIIQDLGLYYLLKKFFPKIRIHASTLMATHNTMAVEKLAAMGYSRVVLPRENTIAEIKQITASTDVEIEVFVHGAMCFSYSGLCLFSSFQGGRSSLRGRCVQPCRRRYTWQGRGKAKGGSGYLFSMNDLEGIDLLPELAAAGVSSLKIEGRMRSSSYVGNVVRAYRMVLDGAPGDKGVLAAARHLLNNAMGRKSTRGYFPTSRPSDVLAPQHSGNIGIFLGKLKPGRGRLATIKINGPLIVGDRLRLHREKSGERQGFSLRKIKVGGAFVEQAAKGAVVSLELPVPAGPGDSIYKVDSAAGRGRPLGRGISPERFAGRLEELDVEGRVTKIIAEISGASRQAGAANLSAPLPGGSKTARPGRGGGNVPLPLWFRSDDPFLVKQRFPIMPERLVINLSGEAFNRFLRMKKSGPLFRRIVWALPFVIDEDKLSFFRERIAGLVELGSREWQIGHVSQSEFFKGLGCRLYGDYTLNVLNSLGARVLKENGLAGGLVSIENDRANLAGICRSTGDFRKGMTVYGFPALFTSRYSGPPMQYDRIFKSPRGESFLLRQAWGYTRALPTQPFSLLAELAGLAKLGLDYGMVDLSGHPLTGKVMEDIARGITGLAKGEKAVGFNFHRTLS
ncbi:MAG: U32 family peptidase [Desulfobulbales bacterium]|nr:U32 family peptidase [Desulfobulbales bacterium]